MSKKKPIEVEAEIMDGGLAALSKADAWLAEQRERVAVMAEQYRPPESIEDERARKEAVLARADCRRDAAEIDAERKAMLRDAEDALKRFKAGVRDVLAPLTELDETYKRLLDEYEERWRAEREIELAREYADIAPDLVPLVPFSRLHDRYGSSKGSQWLMRSTNIEAAKDMLADAVGEIADAERTISELADAGDAEGLKARYFQTLDLQGTLSEARRLAEQRERVRALEEQRREREEQARLAAEQMMERAAAPADEPAPETAPMPAATDAAPEPVTMPERTISATIRMPEEPEAETPHPWVVSVPSATRSEMGDVAAFMRSRGIRFDRIYAGTLAEAYAKEAGDGR